MIHALTGYMISFNIKYTQSVLKEINPQFTLEGLMPKLKLQHFGHQRKRADSLENILILGKIEGRKRRV